MPLRVVDGIVGIDERLPGAAGRGDAGIGAPRNAAVLPNIHYIGGAVALIDVGQLLAAGAAGDVVHAVADLRRSRGSGRGTIKNAAVAFDERPEQGAAGVKLR